MIAPHPHASAAALSIAALLLCTGCGGGDPAAKIERERAVEPAPRVPLSRDEQDRVIRMVHEAVDEESGVTYAVWTETQLAAEKGSLLFEEWSVMPRGGTSYEVRFICTLLQNDATRVQRGYSWSVDGLLHVVGAPRALNFPGSSARTTTPLDIERRRRVLQDQTYSLE